MKKDLKQKIEEMKVAQLEKRAQELLKEITENNLKLMTRSLKNVHANRGLKKELAFIKYTLHMRSLENNTQEDAPEK
jgi:ribosomal protein L29